MKSERLIILILTKFFKHNLRASWATSALIGAFELLCRFIIL